MTVVKFSRPERPQRGWQAAEMRVIVGVCAGSLSSGEASGWQTGRTECGNPQLYLLGPAPEQECILCVSRLGRVYVMEDGAGRVLLESKSLRVLAEQARAFLRSKKSHIVTRATIAWCALREIVEEKIEPVLVETEELLAHFAPQMLALA